jgi:hypothetical protein
MTDDNNNSDRLGAAMQAAWQRLKGSQSRTWSEWMTIGDGLLEGRRWAMLVANTNKPEGKGYTAAYSEWLNRWKVHDMGGSDRAKLLQLMEDRPAVEEWRSTLTNRERLNLNNPMVVWGKWRRATRVKKPKSRHANVSARELGRAQKIIEQQQARIKELEEELSGKKEEIAQLRRELTAALMTNSDHKTIEDDRTKEDKARKQPGKRAKARTDIALQ